MKTTLTLLAILTSLSLFAQTPKIGYYYDAAGNRIQRKVCIACRTSNTDTIHNKYTGNTDSLEATILPNPTQGNLAIKVTQNDINEKEYQLLIYDVSGKAIVNKKYNSSSFTIQLPTQTPPGIYFVKLLSNNKVKQWKITKE